MTTASTSDLSAAMRAHHRALAATLDGYATHLEGNASALDSASLAGLLDGLTSFLTGELLPHARGEEQTLYPALDPILRTQGEPTATMRMDHEYITDYVRQIAETARKLHAARERDRAALARQIELQVLQLRALFAVHLAKEERIYLPLIEQAISPTDQQALLAALHDEAAASPTDAVPAADTLEVRHLPPAQRHQLIVERFNALPVGQSFVLVNDHDPKPLYYQLVAEYVGQLLWQYLEEGPEVWRVRIGKAS